MSGQVSSFLGKFDLSEATINVPCGFDLLHALSESVHFEIAQDDITSRKQQLKNWQRREGHGATMLNLVRVFLEANNPSAAEFVVKYHLGDSGRYIRIQGTDMSYDPDNVLGEGANGSRVFFGFYNKRRVAIKRVNKGLSEQEKNVLLKCENVNVVKYHHVELGREFDYLALELCLKSLHDIYIDGEDKSEELLQGLNVNKRAILEDAIKGLEHLHRNNIIHRDTKPENILLVQRSPDSNDVKAVLSDFGISTEIAIGRHSKTTTKLKGTMSWMAPELLCNETDSRVRCSCQTDIFAMGCVIYFVLSNGKHPFGDRYDEAHQNIKENRYTLDDLDVEEWSAAKDLIESMIHADRQSRPSAVTVLSHCYFWEEKRAFLFYEAVNDFLESRGSVYLLEKNAHNVIGTNWMEKIQKEDIPLIDEKGYDPTMVKDLFRAFKENKERLVKSDGLTTFFKNFPLLLIHTYRQMEIRGSDPTLNYYYCNWAGQLYSCQTSSSINMLNKEKEELGLRIQGLEKELKISERTKVSLQEALILDADTRELQAKLAKNQEYMIKLSEELTEVKQELIEVTAKYEKSKIIDDSAARIAELEEEKMQLQDDLEKKVAIDTDKDILIAKLMKDKSQMQEKSRQQKETSTIGLQFDYLVPSLDNLECLSDVQVAEKKLFLIQGDKPQLMNWEQFGLRIGIEEDSLSSHETAEVATAALVGGQFKFPKNTVLVSAVYAVFLSRPLFKPMHLEMQHCVNLKDQPALSQYLKFAIAPVSTLNLPYQFSIVEGGEFRSDSWYGLIDRNEFCLVCILGQVLKQRNKKVSFSPSGGEQTSVEESQHVFQVSTESRQEEEKWRPEEEHSRLLKHGKTNEFTIFTGIEANMTYAGLTYYENEYSVKFTAVKKLDVLIQFSEMSSKAKIGPQFYFQFKPCTDYIELNSTNPQDELFTGWSITKPCRLHRRDIHNFGEALPPSCLSITVHGSPNAVPVFYSIPIMGVADPVTLHIHKKEESEMLDDTCVTLKVTVSTESTQTASVDPKALQRQTSRLSELLSNRNSRIRLANELYSNGIISQFVYTEAIKSDDQDDYEKSSSLVCSLNGVINEQPHLFKVVIKLLQQDNELCEIAKLINSDI